MSQENVELARAIYAAINRGDLEGFLGLVHPEAEFTSLVAEAEGQTYHGHDGVREWWEKVREALGGLRFDPQHIYDDDGRLYAEVIITGTVEGVEVPQRMWTAALVRDRKAIWWATCRTEAEAREALEAAGLSE
jgi:ketosteroid isomerase-like protein